MIAAMVTSGTPAKRSVVNSTSRGDGLATEMRE